MERITITDSHMLKKLNRDVKTADSNQTSKEENYNV